MSDKERIQKMTAEETEEATIQLLNVVETSEEENAKKAKYFYAGVMAAFRSMSIRPEEFADGCKTSA